MASEYANTLEVIVTTPDRARGYLNVSDTGGTTLSGDRGIALVLRDDTHSQGRQVALDAGAVRDALGHTPKQVYGTHENGEEWTANVEYEAGMLVFEVPHFSSNSVSFSGTVSVSGTYVDGSAVSYDISTLDAVSDFSINVTGSTATETDAEYGSVSTGSGTVSLPVAGNAPPSDATVTVTNAAQNVSHNPATDLGDGTKDGYAEFGDNYYSGSETVRSLSFSIKPSASGNLSTLKLPVDSFKGDSMPPVDVYVVQETADTATGEGSKVVSGWDITMSGDSIETPMGYSVDANTWYTVEIVPQTTTSDGDSDKVKVRTDDSPGSTYTVQHKSSGDNSIQAYTHAIVNVTNPPAESVSVTGDSSTSFGDVSPGSSVTKTVPISLSTSSLGVSYTNSVPVDVNATYTERTETVDPSVTVNGHTTSYSGMLADGSTASLTANDSWIESGTNTVNVSVGDGTLSADAPTPSVALNYTHDATDKQTVDYDAEKWSERYNVSKTYASDRSSASLTIPFDGDVAKIKSIETRTNGGAWSTVSSDNYGFDGTTLTVQLGSVSAGDEVAVRTTGRKVNVINGGITVLEPTLMGDRLDTKFEIDSWQEGAYISLGNTPDGTRINYLYDESWDSDEYAEITADGYHKLYAPGATAGSSARVSTIPVRVNAESGEVRVSVDDALRDEPKFSVAPGASSGDEVEYTFVDAQDDTGYALYSTTRDTTVDQGTANSPLTLSDDDSEETLQFQVDDSDGTASGDGGGGSFFEESSGPIIPAMPVLNPGLVVVIVLGIIAGAIAYQQRRIQRPDVPDRAIYRSPLVILAVIVALFLGILLISPETVTTWITLVLAQPLSNALNAALPLLGVLGVMAGIGIVVYWWWTRRQAKTAEAGTPDTVLRINADEGDK
jgi:hypothetical protein